MIGVLGGGKVDQDTVNHVTACKGVPVDDSRMVWLYFVVGKQGNK